MNCFIALLLSGLLSLAANAQDAQRIPLTTKSGRAVNAEVLSLKDGMVELKVYGLGGDATVKRNLDVFVPESVFLIEYTAANAKTFDQHFALAKRAAELDLLPQAGYQARLAIQASAADPDAAAKKKQIHDWAADALEHMIQQAVAAGNLDRAGDCLQLLTTRLPETRTEEQLAAITDLVDGLRRGIVAKFTTDCEARLEVKQKEEIARKLEPIRSKITSGDKLLSKAIAQSNNTVASAASCEGAVNFYKAAWQACKDLASQYGNDSDLQRELGGMIEQIESSALQAAFHAANVLTSQTDYNGAKAWVNRVLKYDPTNADAKAMMQTITQAQADSGNYRYGWRRR